MHIHYLIRWLHTLNANRFRCEVRSGERLSNIAPHPIQAIDDRNIMLGIRVVLLVIGPESEYG